MTEKWMERMNWAKIQEAKLDLVSRTSHIWHFFCLCEDVEVAMENFKTMRPIFVV